MMPLRTFAIAALVAAVLAACGKDPDSLLASAKDYLAKNDTKAAVIQIKNALQENPQLPEARFLLGKTLLESGDGTGAEVELQKALDYKYPPDQVLPLLTKAWLATGQFRKVADEVPKMALTAPEAKAEIQNSLSVAQAMLGKADQAKAAVAEALATKPDHAPALLTKARLMLAESDLDNAMQTVEGVLAKDAGNRDAWLMKGDILALQNKGEDSKAAYRKVISLRPDTAPAHVALVTALLREQKFDEAEKQFAGMKAALPNHPQTLYLELRLAYLKKDYTRGRELAQQLLRVQPNHPGVLELAGAVEYQLKSYVQAEDYFSKALSKNPNAGLARRLLILSLLRGGHADRALTLLEPVLGQIDKDADMLAMAGQIYLQNGDTGKAETYFAKAAALAPKDAAKQTALALTHMAQGNVASASDELERIAAEDKGITADMALITSALQRKDFARALQAIVALEKKRPGDPAVAALRGRTLAAKGDLAGARASLEKALAAKPDYFPAAAALAGLDLQDKKPEQAEKRFESVLAKDPKNVSALLALADVKIRTGAKPEVVEPYFAKAVQAVPNHSMTRLAQINFYLASKQPKKAVSAAQEAIAALPGDAGIYDALGRAQQAAGETAQALASYGKLAGMQPASAQPHIRMAEIHLQNKDKAAAGQSLLKALEIQPDALPAQRGLIMLLLDQGKFDEAMKHARAVQKQRAKEGVGFALEGDIATLRKAWPDAANAYRNSLKLTPLSDVAGKLQTVLVAGGKAAEADKFAATWLAQHPKDGGFRLHLASQATARQDYAGAARHYQAMLQDQPDSPLVLNNLAWVLGQKKDPKALEYAEKANRLAPNQPGIMDTLALLLADAGQNGRALELLTKAVELAPKADIIKLSLAKVQIKAGKKEDARKLLDGLAALGDKFPAQAEVGALLKGLR